MKVILNFENGPVEDFGGAETIGSVGDEGRGSVWRGPGYVTSNEVVRRQDLITGVVCVVRVGVGRLRPQRHVGLRPRSLHGHVSPLAAAGKLSRFAF